MRASNPAIRPSGCRSLGRVLRIDRAARCRRPFSSGNLLPEPEQYRHAGSWNRRRAKGPRTRLCRSRVGGTPHRQVGWQRPVPRLVSQPSTGPMAAGDRAAHPGLPSLLL